jgi:hypothetical protein
MALARIPVCAVVATVAVADAHLRYRGALLVTMCLCTLPLMNPTALGQPMVGTNSHELLEADRDHVARLLDSARPLPASPEIKAAILASLPQKGEVTDLDLASQQKLRALAVARRGKAGVRVCHKSRRRSSGLDRPSCADRPPHVVCRSQPSDGRRVAGHRGARNRPRVRLGGLRASIQHRGPCAPPRSGARVRHGRDSAAARPRTGCVAASHEPREDGSIQPRAVWDRGEREQLPDARSPPRCCPSVFQRASTKAVTPREEISIPGRT